MAADKPGEKDSGKLLVHNRGPCVCSCIITIGTQAKEYPTRFFARDYGGNLLEFTM
jgi:hypothetical protein